MHWYLIHTKPRQEQRALLNLEQQGICCYLPLMPAERLQSGNLHCSEEPLFARYLFAHLDAHTGRGLAPINFTKGVSRVVTFGNQPARVSEDLVLALQQAEQQLMRAPVRLYQPGESVRIQEGPFRGLEAVFRMHDGASRAMVLIELLSRPTEIAIPLASLRKVR